MFERSFYLVNFFSVLCTLFSVLYYLLSLLYLIDASHTLGKTMTTVLGSQAKVILKKTTGTVNGSQRDAEQCAGKGGDMFERSELPRPKLLRQAANSKILPNE